MSILIVEDDKVNGTILERMLSSEKFETLTCSNGVEALKLLRSRMDIDVVVADIMMPEMNGLEMLRDIRESLLLSDTPVILCSGVTDRGKVQLAAALGCTSFLVKPIQKTLLLKKIAAELSKAKPVLVSVREAMARGGFDQNIYLKTAHVLIDALEENIRLVNYKQRHPESPTLEPKLDRVLQLSITLGAERLASYVRLYQQVPANKEEIRLRYVRMVWAMERVLVLLKTQISREFGE